MNIDLQITVSVTGFVVRCLARHIYEAFPQSIFTRHIQHSICIEDSNAIRLLICTKMNDQYKKKLGTLVYLHTLDSQIMYYLKITGNWNHIYINYLPAIEYTYLNLDVEATICQSPKHINTRIHMTSK